MPDATLHRLSHLFLSDVIFSGARQRRRRRQALVVDVSGKPGDISVIHRGHARRVDIRARDDNPLLMQATVLKAYVIKTQ